MHSIFKKLKRLADKELNAFEFTSTEMRLLNMIYFYDADGCNQDEFISKMEIDRSNVGRSLKKLQNLGYIKREKHRDDKRAFLVFLTDKGRAAKDKLMEIRKEFGFDTPEFDTLMKSTKIRTKVAEDKKEGKNNDVRGTPTVFVNGKQLKDKRLQGFRAAIERELQGAN